MLPPGTNSAGSGTRRRSGRPRWTVPVHCARLLEIVLEDGRAHRGLGDMQLRTEPEPAGQLPAPVPGPHFLPQMGGGLLGERKAEEGLHGGPPNQPLG